MFIDRAANVFIKMLISDRVKKDAYAVFIKEKQMKKENAVKISSIKYGRNHMRLIVPLLTRSIDKIVSDLSVTRNCIFIRLVLYILLLKYVFVY